MVILYSFFERYDAVCWTDNSCHTAPVLSNVRLNTPHSGPGASVTMMGFNFGMLQYTPTTILAGGVCNTASWNSRSSLRCRNGPMTLDHSYAQIAVLSQVGTGSGLFSFDGTDLH